MAQGSGNGPPQTPGNGNGPPEHAGIGNAPAHSNAGGNGNAGSNGNGNAGGIGNVGVGNGAANSTPNANSPAVGVNTGNAASPNVVGTPNPANTNANAVTPALPETGGAADPGPIIQYSEDEARDAASSGIAVSLSRLLPDIAARTGGNLVDAQLLQVRGFKIYALKVLNPDGRVSTEYYYAQSGVFIGSEP